MAYGEIQGFTPANQVAFDRQRELLGEFHPTNVAQPELAHDDNPFDKHDDTTPARDLSWQKQSANAILSAAVDRQIGSAVGGVIGSYFGKKGELRGHVIGSMVGQAEGEWRRGGAENVSLLDVVVAGAVAYRFHRPGKEIKLPEGQAHPAPGANTHAVPDPQGNANPSVPGANTSATPVTPDPTTSRRPSARYSDPSKPANTQTTADPHTAQVEDTLEELATAKEEGVALVNKLIGKLGAVKGGIATLKQNLGEVKDGIATLKHNVWEKVEIKETVANGVIDHVTHMLFGPTNHRPPTEP